MRPDPTLVRRRIFAAGVTLGTAVAMAAGIVTPASCQTTAQTSGQNGAMLLPAGYAQVFFHDFPGTTLDSSVWPILYGGGSANGYFQFAHDDVAVNNGLTITFRQENGVWTTGGIGMGQLGTTYGLFEFYARTDHKQGVGPVLLLWPCNNSWPPEIDVLEAPNGNNQAFQTLHWSSQNLQISTPTAIDPTQWHDYAVDWEPNGVTFFIDGRTTATIPNNSPNQCMAPGISGYIANPGDTWYGSPPTDTTPSSFQVAWMRVAKPPGSPAFANVASSSGAPTTTSLPEAAQASADAGISIPAAGAPSLPSSADMATATSAMQADLAAASGTGLPTASTTITGSGTADQVPGGGSATTPGTLAPSTIGSPANATLGTSPTIPANPATAASTFANAAGLAGLTGQDAATVAAALATGQNAQPTCLGQSGGSAICGRGATTWNQFLWTSPGYDVLVGGQGQDSFLVDLRHSDGWAEIVGWHPGDSLALAGYPPGQGSISWSEGTDPEGNAGATATIRLAANGPVVARITFIGVPLAQARSLSLGTTTWRQAATPWWSGDAMPTLQ